MSILKKIPLLVILSGIITINSTCTKQKWFSKVTYEGNVYHLNGSPAKGVLILLEACSSSDGSIYCSNNKYTISQVYTDVSGHFYINEHEARTKVYFVSCNLGALNSEGIESSDLKTTKYTKLYIQ
ncbi:MAG TPA: hypothetical protein VNZ49_12715 [Bacteroidia bacterium]|jgi:hypothetical protein|nr:hypothetical protein [Bacteroidia bacterium]